MADGDTAGDAMTRMGELQVDLMLAVPNVLGSICANNGADMGADAIDEACVVRVVDGERDEDERATRRALYARAGKALEGRAGII
ncbi:hypothetical protein AcV7_009369 [Taiwanofungus camphoratus]|nr:hypothetical protein AcV7_009369 [Antrodia cinnamomea]